MLEEALTAYQETIPLVRELDAYYGSEDWRRDFADDEAGKLPPSLKRGVLSEDAAFDALEDNRQLLIRILETAVHALKKQ